MFSVFARSSVLYKAVSRLIQEPIALNNYKLTMGSSYSRSYSPNDKWKSSGIDNSCDSAREAAKMDSKVLEKVVCGEDELADNEMKEFDMGDDMKVLLAKQNGRFHAVGTKCTHYGAPLIKGALGNGRIRCPWHGACFDLKTGDIEDFPGFDSLPCYNVTVTEKGQVKVSGRYNDFKNNVRVKSTSSRMPCSISSCSGNQVVIIGGGPSGATCAETLRMEGFLGTITIIAKEPHLPYDRIKVSKLGMVTDIERIQPRTQQYYDDAKIGILTGVTAMRVDTAAKVVHLSNNEHCEYTSLYIATGSKPRVPNIPGIADANAKNIFTVRNYEDNVNILNALSVDKDVVILGLGFIGLEMGAVCVDKAKSVTIVGKQGEPLERVFGHLVGARIKTFMEEKGIKFHLNTTIAKAHVEDDMVVSVELADKAVLPTDVLILGIGTTYNTEFLANSEVTVKENGAIEVNDLLETNVEGVYAGGDIAYAPVAVAHQKMNIGHIGLAQSHGRVAALNIMHKRNPIKTVPFFWTVLFGKSIRYAGCGRAESSMLVGDLEALTFVIFFFDKNEKVISVASCNKDPVVAQFAEFMYQGKTLAKKDLKENPFAWVGRIRPGTK